MATWTASTAIPSGGLITSAWMSNVTGMVNFLGAASAASGKDLFFARQTVGQSIAPLVPTALTFTTEDIDVANGHSLTTNTSRYTAQAAGKYRLTGGVAVPYYGVGFETIIVRFKKNGTNISSAAAAVFVNAAALNGQFCAMPVYYLSLAAGDYVELFVTTSTSITTDVSGQQSCFGVEWVGA